MRFVVILCLFLVIFAVSPPARASNPLEVQQALSGTVLKLADGSQGVLTGLFVPDAQQAAAQTALQKIIDATHPSIIPTGSPDRYGRWMVYGWRDGAGHVAQPERTLVQDGLAFVWPPVGDVPDLRALLKIESEARKASRGLWQAGNDYADLPADQPDTVLAHDGRFVFVTGKVLKAQRVKNKVYLNFGEDWHTDFTIEIAAHDLRDFRHAGLDPEEDYTQKNIRVRGWVIRDNGPMITVTNPAQIKILP
ncbi:MAG: thermonuclease family protein [Alphaproteobacteria bacterium]|nr:thermonuclease family protein [Alphaproteobacteria bacterium]MBV8548499.1 thermonuclease family protein [Alphaproteobacteria bacterium]